MSELTPIQSQVLAGLLSGKSVSAVARENGIHRSTIYEWRHEQPYFTLALDQARSRHQTALFDLVQGLAEQALETVAEMLASQDANLRLRAAQAILRIAAPSHPSKAARSGMEFEALSDHTLARAAKVPPAPEPKLEAALIRHNPTESDTPIRTKPQFPLRLRLWTEIQALLRQRPMPASIRSNQIAARARHTRAEA